MQATRAGEGSVKQEVPAVTIETNKLLIDGSLVDASDVATYDNVNPATEQVLGPAPDASAADMQRAIAAARRAFEQSGWAEDASLRAKVLAQLQDALRDASQELGEIIVSETGAPVSLLSGLQFAWGLDFVTTYTDLAASYDYERELSGGHTLADVRRIVRREPAGVVAAITPWNYPFFLNLGKTFAALSAGCSVVLKPAPETPWTATALGAIAARATDLPPGILNVVTTADNGVAELLTTAPEVDVVSFTGSTTTGRRIMANAADTVKKVTLELGGKSAAILLDDADFDRAVPFFASASCRHAGQGCGLNTRLLVPRARLDEAVEIARATMEGVAYGDPRDPATTMGPVISRRQMDRVLSYIEIGKQEGRLVTGGGRAEQFDKGFFIQPTLITDIDPSARVCQEEIFGPVLVVIPFDGDDAAVRIANDSIYGISGAVESADLDRALGVARRVRTGTFSVNGAPWLASTSPFGGYKQSGVGREWGVEGFEEFLETKTIAYPTSGDRPSHRTAPADGA